MNEETRRRIQADVLGQVIGNELGAPTESMSRADLRTTFGRVSGFLSSDPAGTDDTEYAAGYGVPATSGVHLRALAEQLVNAVNVPS
ncbi:hypothetical protein G3T36_17675 [Diaminobutyricibacter tongyongensis]|uniref:Uncharacterized protein n=1 Tax=Leifsonia tongyongensis TaxID=1268043 RepID=A0A6L9Y1W7_9MICO|nr:hypothetical protein [Diaminobutyricibacter tongyongensis]NEN07689.1 hypothetical protein [Diaminobutyricibacter tongyongensis]